MAIGKEFWKEALEMLEILLQLATTLDKITFFGLLQAEFINLSGFIFDKLLPPCPNPDQIITNIISITFPLHRVVLNSTLFIEYNGI